MPGTAVLQLQHGTLAAASISFFCFCLMAIRRFACEAENRFPTPRAVQPDCYGRSCKTGLCYCATSFYAALRGERTAAAATTRRLGILKHEALLDQILFVIERRIVKVEVALRIDEDARAILFEHFVAIARFGIEAHRVAQAGAAAALHADAKAAGLLGH